MKQLEHNLQVACVTWFRLQYPDILIYAIPNGGQRNAATGAILKREGVLAGVPDLHIPYSNGFFNSLYIELKVGNNKPSKRQKEVINRLISHNNRVEVVYSIDEFIKIVETYFIDSQFEHIKFLP